MKFPEIQLKKSFLAHLIAIVGEHNLSMANIDRLSYCRDANFRSAIEAHYSHFEHFPSVIAWPQTIEQVGMIIKSARQYKIPVIPFGGGSGVCGGTLAMHGGIIIDLKKLNKIIRIDEDRLFADVQCGILGMELEKKLNRRGYTLGHFPSSILSATLGGYIAARSAGQMSSKYGKIEDMIIDLDFVDGCGRLHRTTDATRSRALDLTQMFTGSEGTLGIALKVRLKIFPLPEHRRFASFSLANMNYGMEAMRRIMQSGIKPDVLRLYDELDTFFVLSKTSDDLPQTTSLDVSTPDILKNLFNSIKSTSMKFAFRGRKLINEFANISWNGCILIVMLEGEREIIDLQIKIISTICEDLDAKNLGEAPAMHWHKHRYSVSYKASKLFTEGAFTDTMEVATTWSNLDRLYQGVRSRLKSHAIVLAHVSHVYGDGAAIYFTVVSPLIGFKKSLNQYDKIWHVALDAVQEFDGVISHHHGIGRLKKKHQVAEWGEAQSLYRKLKNYFDPDHILNPGALIEDAKHD